MGSRPPRKHKKRKKEDLTLTASLRNAFEVLRVEAERAERELEHAELVRAAWLNAVNNPPQRDDLEEVLEESADKTRLRSYVEREWDALSAQEYALRVAVASRAQVDCRSKNITLYEVWQEWDFFLLEVEAFFTWFYSAGTRAWWLEVTPYSLHNKELTLQWWGRYALGITEIQGLEAIAETYFETRFTIRMLTLPDLESREVWLSTSDNAAHHVHSVHAA